ncbi:hypothetical protein KKG65_03160 [Patescibacteria group bacterium]|nr:hypothetical protein [Patescibacteria group bacterium]
MEKGQWGKVREPSLLLSNHPPLWRMIELFKDISMFSNEGKGVVVVMDAAFLKLAQSWFGFDGIPVDVKWSKKRFGGLDAYLMSMVVRKWGEISGAYDEAFGAMEVVKQMRDVLDLGRNVFLCPAAGGNVSGKWRSGVACLARGIYEDGVEEDLGVGLIFVDKGRYSLLPFGNMVDFIDRATIEEITNNRRLAVIMQEIWREKMGQTD